MKPNNSRITISSEYSEPSRPATMVAMVSSLVLCFQLFVILRLYIKHKKKSNAENLFEINFLVDIFVTLLIFTCFLPLEDLFSGFSCFCATVNFLLYFSKFSLFVDICLYQYDRYLYLKLKSSYKVVPQHAIDKIMSAKVVILFFTCFAVVVDRNIIDCGKDEFFVCNEMQNDNIYWFTLPMCICLIYIIFVIWYAVKVIILEESKMNLSSHSPSPLPVLTNRGQTISTICTAPPPIASYLTENVHAIEEDIVIEDIENGEEEQSKTEIIRRTSHPHVFHKINSLEAEVIEQSSPRLLTLIKVEMVKKILQFNIRGLCILLCLLPQSILYIYVYITGNSCSDTPNLLIAAVICKLLLLFPIIVLFVFAHIRK